MTDPFAKLAVIDLGSNSVRLQIGRVRGDGDPVVIHEDRDPVRLGEDVFRTGVLSPAAMERTIAALGRMAGVIRREECRHVFAVATASVREAKNRDAFIDRVHRETGLSLEVISGGEEARLIGLGILHGTPVGTQSLLVDIGGGSTEVSIARGEWVRQARSLPLGAVRLSELFLQGGDPPRKKELASLRDHIRKVLDENLGPSFVGRSPEVVGSAGTIVAVAKYARSLARRKDDGPIASSLVSRAADDLASRTRSERLKLVEPRRADIVVAGAIALSELLAYLHVGSLRTTERGLRDGLMLELARRALPANANNDDRDRAMRAELVAFGRRCGFREAHSEHVAHLALQLFDGTHALHGLGARERRILEAAALLHGVGAFVNPHRLHRHTQYLLQNAELPGFTEDERSILALVARYHRGSPPREKHEAFAALPPPAREIVRRLAALLRVADGLDRGSRRTVRALSVVRHPQRTTLLLDADGDVQLELASASGKADLFRQTFGVDLSLEVRD